MDQWVDWLRLAVGGATMVLLVSTAFSIYRSSKHRVGETLPERAVRLRVALHEATFLMEELTREISARQAALEDVQGEVERYEQLRALGPKQIAALDAHLAATYKSEARKSFWQGVGVNAVFFILGVVATVYLGPTAG